MENLCYLRFMKKLQQLTNTQYEKTFFSNQQTTIILSQFTFKTIFFYRLREQKLINKNKIIDYATAGILNYRMIIKVALFG